MSWDPDNDIVNLPTFNVNSDGTSGFVSEGGGGFASGVSSLFGALGGLLGNVAQGVGQGIANNVVTRATSSGRTPGAETLANPLSQPTATAAQPTSIIPGIDNKTLLLVGGGAVALGVLAIVLTRGK